MNKSFRKRIAMLSLVLWMITFIQWAFSEEKEGTGKIDPKAGKESAASSTGDMWAKALWLCATNEEDLTPLFLSALSSATNKAPIYVSIGDYYSGPFALVKLAQDTRAQAEQSLVMELQQALGDTEALDSVFNKDGAARAVARLLADFVNESYKKHLHAMADGLNENEIEETSLRLYLAAASEAPDDPVPWSRIAAARSDNKILHSHALAEFMRTAPENAMPHYLQAFSHMETGNPTLALESVKLGNKKRRCIVYKSPLPERFTLRYPPTADYEAAGVAGKLVSETALRTLLRPQGVFPEMRILASLRSLGRGLTKHGEDLRKTGQAKAAGECFEAVANMGLHLVNVEPRDVLFMLSGAAIADLAASPYDDLCAARGMASDRAALGKMVVALKTFADECRAIASSTSELLELAEPEAAAVFLKKIEAGDFSCDKEQLSLEKALEKAGLLGLSL